MRAALTRLYPHFKHRKQSVIKARTSCGSAQLAKSSSSKRKCHRVGKPTVRTSVFAHRNILRLKQHYLPPQRFFFCALKALSEAGLKKHHNLKLFQTCQRDCSHSQNQVHDKVHCTEPTRKNRLLVTAAKICWWGHSKKGGRCSFAEKHMSCLHIPGFLVDPFLALPLISSFVLHF